MSHPLRRHNVFFVIAAIAALFGGAAVFTAISHQSPTHAASNKLAAARSLPLTPSQEVVNYLDKGEDAHYCDGCTPPLTNDGGPVVNTTGTIGLTITPIFWQPAGSSATNSFPANYQSIIDGFIGNVATASGTTSNVFSIATEYYSQINGVKTPITYKITMGTPIVDTHPFPGKGCTPNATDNYTSCVTDAQLQTELTSVLTANSLPSDLAHFYPVFFPPNTETFGIGTPAQNSDSDYCGYHSAYINGTSETLYGNEPYEAGGCDGGEAPSGQLYADGAVGTLSHELSETMTDPNGSGIAGGPAWGDSTGHEIGDECSGFYGPKLGSTDNSSTAAANSTAYNEVINGGKYYIQNEFSNSAYARLGIGNGCQPSEATATSTTPQSLAADTTGLGSFTNDAFPNALPANGKATSQIDISIGDKDGYAIADDRVNYSIYAITGKGYCGTLDHSDATTDSGGHADVTYTASTSNVICAIVGTDVDGGQSATGMVYQGTYQSQTIKANQDFPKKLTEGTAPKRFQTWFINRASTPQYDARIQFGIFADDGSTDNVPASKVDLSYSVNGPAGTYHRVALTGGDITDGEIQGVVLPLGGVTIPANSTLRIYYHISLKTGISTKGGGANLDFEAYLDQVDPADGALSTFGDTLAYPVTVLAG